MKFSLAQPSVRWITATLRTVISKSLRRISIDLHDETISEAVNQEWQDLDHLLVQFWTSHSIRPRIVYVAKKGKGDLRDHVLSWLPELTRRGLIDLSMATN